MQGDVGKERTNDPALRCALLGGVEHAIFHIACLQPTADHSPCGEVADSLHKGVMVDIVETAFDIGIKNPDPFGPGLGCQIYPLDGVMDATTGPEPVACPLELRFPTGLKCIEHNGLLAPVDEGRDSERPFLTARFRDIHPPGWKRLPCLEVHQLVRKVGPLGRRQCGSRIDTGRGFPAIDLADPSDGNEQVRPAAQHQLLQRANRLPVPHFSRPIDSPAQRPDGSIGGRPVNGLPVNSSVAYDQALRPVHLFTNGSVAVPRDYGGLTSHLSAPFQVGHGPIRRVMYSPCLSAGGIRF